MKILLTLLILASCGKHREKQHIEPEFFPFVDEFVTTYGTKVSSNIYFSNLKNNWIGVCYWNSGKRNKIYIDREFWQNSSTKQKYAVMFHEFGHCEKYLEHDDRLMDDGCPVTFMSTVLTSNFCLHKHKKYYLTNL